MKILKKIARLVDEGYGATQISTKLSYLKGGTGKIIARYKLHGLEGILHKKNKVITLDKKIL